MLKEPGPFEYLGAFAACILFGYALANFNLSNKKESKKPQDNV